MDSTGTFPTTLIYVASSWRNQVQPKVVQALDNAGFGVYDFRNPTGSTGFAFSELAEAMNQEGTYENWNHEAANAYELSDVLNHPMCERGFRSDMDALEAADIVVLVLPSERDAHLELGYAVGAGKQTHVLLDNPTKASLMYKMVDFLHPSLEDLLLTLGASDV